MNKADITQLLQQHDREISELQISTRQMMLIWKCVGMVTLVALGAWLTQLLRG